jgi:GntR family transcriptional regulator
MIHIDYRDPRPIYEQVKDSLRRLVLSGALPPGEKLPSVRELATSLTINPNTIQRAYRELEAEGYIVSVPGRGSFVREEGSTFSARRAELLKTLRGMDMLELSGEGWVPAYTRDDVTDALHDAFGFRTDYEIVTNRQMGKVLTAAHSAKVKKVPKGDPV